MERWERIEPCPLKELGKDGIIIIMIASEEKCKALHKFAWEFYAWSGMVSLSQASEETHVNVGWRGQTLKKGDWFLWRRKDAPHSQRQKEQLFALKDAFNAGYRFAMEPIWAAEAAEKEAAEKEWKDACERVVGHFYHLDKVYEEPDTITEDSVTLVMGLARRADEDGYYESYYRGDLYLHFPKDTRMPGLYKRLPKAVMNQQEWYYSGWTIKHRGKMVHGYADAETYVKHLRLWAESYPDDPANKVYLAIAKAIGVLG